MDASDPLSVRMVAQQNPARLEPVSSAGPAIRGPAVYTRVCGCATAPEAEHLTWFMWSMALCGFQCTHPLSRHRLDAGGSVVHLARPGRAVKLPMRELLLAGTGSDVIHTWRTSNAVYRT